MKVMRVVEVQDSRLKRWAADLGEAELRMLCPDPQSRWAPWDIYLNWLLVMGWQMKGVLGRLVSIDEDRKVLIALEGEGAATDPQLPDG